MLRSQQADMHCLTGAIFPQTMTIVDCFLAAILEVDIRTLNGLAHYHRSVFLD